jgi:hypothetical protein
MSFCTKCGGANDANAAFCRACGAALPAAAVGVRPGVAAAPAPMAAGAGAGLPAAAAPASARKKMSPVLKIVLILITIFVIIPGVAALVFSIAMMVKYGGTASEVKKDAKDPCETSSFLYLLALQEGKSIAAAYWKPGVTPETLFAVRSFNVIKHGSFIQPGGKPYKIPRVYYEYEVESSSKMGIPIRKRWNIVMETDTKNFGNEPCAIVQLAEAE